MKSIKELGLEIIQLEDQVLLVNTETINLGDYHFENGKIKIFGYYSKSVGKKIISSTKPLEGLPLLVIEDEAMSNALNLIEESKIETESTKLILIGAYTTGYNKAKETYKFTELDLRFALDHGRSQGYEYASMETFQDSEDLKKLELEQKEDKEEFIQSLTKKELWIEVEGYKVNGMIDEATSYRPKITESKIKGIWK